MNHVGIIMDGNRRWAKEKNRPASFGHKKGAENLISLTKFIFKRGVKVLSLFAFSTENFKRSDEEVNNLMNLFIKYAKTNLKKLTKDDVRIVFSGRRDNLRDDVLKALEELESENINGQYILNICFNYGGRDEIIRSAIKLSRDLNDNKININEIDEEVFKAYLDQNLPDMDLLIRTGGDKRISNFMLYSLSYAELYFTPTYFPSFNKEEYVKIEEEFMKRNRRFGK